MIGHSKKNKEEKFRRIELSEEEETELYGSKGFSCAGGFALVFLIIIVFILVIIGLLYFSMRFDVDLFKLFE
ncbi:hypothetical protein [Marinilactibacillus sp. Marseille-P9653]|uniref:hypothetical protein n=1 Tax=Marinilactibacillus sp. Marseille-P9653 TaxID=2866583 RepID=UPI001CE4531B|nr:hypothetical protein [Marinilactibacillus sp. Marseille-P9653]